MTRAIESTTDARRAAGAQSKAGGVANAREESKVSKRREQAVKVSISNQARRAAEEASQAEAAARTKTNAAKAARLAKQ